MRRRDEADSLPTGTVLFSTGTAPALQVGGYTITVTHTVSPPGQTAPLPLNAAQTILVQGPEFVLPPQLVAGNYPPDDGADAYADQLPFISFADANLPWEVELGFGAPTPWPTPWMALALFAEGEIVVDAATGSPLVASTVSDFITGSAMTLPPELDTSDFPASVLNSQCQLITLPIDSFSTLLPPLDDLPYLAHRRSVNVPGEPQQTVSVVLGNRLPVASTASPNVPVRYYAHLVSLLGFPGVGAPVAGDYTEVRLVSLYNWTFLAMPEVGANFETVCNGLVASEAASGAGALALPLAGSPAGVPTAAVERLASGYVALDFHAFDSQTFAWYRGPLAPVPPVPLPAVGWPPAAVDNATSSDSLLVYLSDQGVFDASYAAAWNLGRGLALADGSFTSALLAYRRQAAQNATLLAQRAALPRHAGAAPRALLRRRVSRDSFLGLLDEGLGRRWTAALERSNSRIDPESLSRRAAVPAPLALADLLARPDVVAALADSVAETAAQLAYFLGGLSLLAGVPFSALVPDPRMLPVESIRFFYVDRDWIAAMLAGATSLGLQSSTDLALHLALWPRLAAAVDENRRRRFARPVADFYTPGASPGSAASGMLVRSQLVAAFPTANVTAQDALGPLAVISDVTLSPSVRLCLFDGVPESVTIAEPYHGLRFGFEEGAAGDGPVVSLRALSGDVGTPLGASLVVAPYCAPSGVLQVADLAAAIAAYPNPSVGASSLDPGELAIELVLAPLAQTFSFSA